VKSLIVRWATWIRPSLYKRPIFFFSFAQCPVSSEAHPAFYTIGIGDSFPGVKQMELDADHPFSSRVEAKNAWKAISASHTSSCA
jgi:hypothetical protein